MTDDPVVPAYGVTPELLTALSTFQTDHHTAPRDVKGRYDYASLESLTHAVSAATKLGLGHTFLFRPFEVPDAGVTHTQVTLVLFHVSGGFFESSLVIADYDPDNRRDSRAQQRGSNITYAKRYLLAAAYSLAPGGDQGESGDVVTPAPAKPVSKPPMQQKAPAPKPAPKPAAKADIKFLDEAVKEALVIRISLLDKDTRQKLMLDFKDAFDIKCAGAPNRDYIQLPGHGEWLVEKLDGMVI